MARRSIAKKKKVPLDIVYGSPIVTKFINFVMKNGEKSVASAIVYYALDETGRKTEHSVPEFMQKILENTVPLVEVKSRRIGGATYQVPVDVLANRGLALALKWIVKSASKRSDKTFKLRLSAELLDAFNGRGGAVKKREESHKAAESNKAYSHFRW